eukprot:scaffold52604_cov72-Phaeocystis_antarctica.AAC.1
MPSSTRAAAPACRPAEALEVRYRAAGGVGEEAHSRQPHWCPWSKSMNVETCGHVADLIVMAHAFAELRDGVVARQHEERFRMWAQFQPHPLRLWSEARLSWHFDQGSIMAFNTKIQKNARNAINGKIK